MLTRRIALLVFIPMIFGLLTQRQLQFLVNFAQEMSVFRCIFASDSKKGSINDIKYLSKHQIISSYIRTNQVTHYAYSDKFHKIMCILKQEDADISSILNTNNAEFQRRHIIWLILAEEHENVSSFWVPYDGQLYIAVIQQSEVLINEAYRLGDETKIRQVGLWTSKLGIQIPQANFVLRRLNVEGYRITRESYSGMPQEKNELVVTQRELIDGITAVMNFSTDSIPMHGPPDEYWDVSENPQVSPNGYNYQVVGPSIQLKFFLHVKKELETLRYFFIKPFHPNVWALLICWMVVAAIIPLPAHLFLLQVQKFLSKLELIFVPMDAFCNQDGMRDTAICMTIKLVKLFCRVCAGIVVTTFCASIVSFMTVRLPFTPFQSLVELATHEKYKIGVSPNTYQEHYFKNSDNPVVQQIYSSMVPPANQQPVTVMEGIERMCKDNYFVYVGYNANIFKFKSVCKILQIKEPITKQFMCFSLNLKVAYFGIAFRKFLGSYHSSGIMSRHQKRLDSKLTPDDDLNADEAIKAVPLGLVIQVMAIIPIGIALAFVVLALELKICKRQRIVSSKWP